MYLHIRSLLFCLNGEEPEHSAQVYWPVGPSYKTGPEPDRPARPQTGIDIYPNPSDGNIILQWNWFEAGIDGPLDMKLYDMQGRPVWQQRLKAYKDNSYVIRAGHLSPGAYVLEVACGERRLESQSISIFH